MGGKKRSTERGFMVISEPIVQELGRLWGGEIKSSKDRKGGASVIWLME